MKKIMALALIAALALTGCTPRADRASRNDHGSTQPDTPPAQIHNQPAPPPPDTSSIDSDLSGVDSLLNGVDDDLSAAAKTPDDAD